MCTISLLLLTESLGIFSALEGLCGGSVLSSSFRVLSCAVRASGPLPVARGRTSRRVLLTQNPPSCPPVIWQMVVQSTVAYFIPRSVPSLGTLGLCPPLLKGKEGPQRGAPRTGDAHRSPRGTDALDPRTPCAARRHTPRQWPERDTGCDDTDMPACSMHCTLIREEHFSINTLDRRQHLDGVFSVE